MTTPTPTKEQIRQARIDARLTQKAAAERAGVTERAWRDYELGKYSPKQSAWRLFTLLTQKDNA